MIRPYKKNPSPKGVAILRKDRRVLDESGALYKLSEVPSGVVVYADREIANKLLHAGDGEGVCWNQVPIRWEADGASVILLGSYPGAGLNFLRGLITLRDFLADHGAGMGSMASSSWSLLRATLDRPLLCWGGDERPPITEVIGGRQEPFVNPGHYGAFEVWDLSAAYAKTLGELVYPGSWEPWNGPLPDAGSPFPCFVWAHVYIPAGTRMGPLPRRKPRPDKEALWRRLELRDYPTGQRMSGVWSLEELRAAEEVGATFKVRRAWVMVGHTRTPFAGWWDAIQEARKLPGYAGTLAKTMGNTLWGRFCAFGDRERVTYADGRPTFRADNMPQAPREMQPLDAAELVTSHIRTRLYRELMTPFADRLISVHTDGGLLFPDPLPTPNLFDLSTPDRFADDWRLKDRGRSLIYLGPQAYAYRRGASYVYRVSGVDPKHVRSVFASQAKSVLNLPGTGNRPRWTQPADDAWKGVPSWTT